MSRSRQDIQADITEAKQIILTAKRPTNQSVLAKHLSALKTQLQSLPIPEQKPQNVQPKKEQNKSQQIKIRYTSLTKYSWEQQGSKIKIYFTLQNIGNQCPADNIDVQFEKQAVQVKIRNYKKQNLIFSIKKLFAPIEYETSKYLLKTNMLVLTMFKKQKKNWSQLNYKEESLGNKKDNESQFKNDPNAGIMNMMKKMYEEGDQNMKRTIAEAWTKSQDKKSGDPLGDMDMGKYGDRGFGFKGI